MDLSSACIRPFGRVQRAAGALLTEPVPGLQEGSALTCSIGRMTPEHETYVEHLMDVSEELTGISLEQLGFEPRPEDLSADELNDLEAGDLDWMESVTPEQRDRSLFQARLLAGALWEASSPGRTLRAPSCCRGYRPSTPRNTM